MKKIILSIILLLGGSYFIYTSIYFAWLSSTPTEHAQIFEIKAIWYFILGSGLLQLSIALYIPMWIKKIKSHCKN
jgi:hypothetical protein